MVSKVLKVSNIGLTVKSDISAILYFGVHMNHVHNIISNGYDKDEGG